MGWLLRTGLVILSTMTTMLVGCAAADDESPEDLGSDSQSVTAGGQRCAGTTATRTTTVKVMSINLRHDSDEWERRFKMIADEIVRLDPDLIGTQEVEIAKDQADKLNDLIAQRGHAKYNLYEKRKSGFVAFFGGEGIAIMSRWPITEKNHEDIGEQRVSIIARVKHPRGGFIDMVDTHLDQHGGAEGDADRDDEAKQTVDLIKRNDDCWPTFFTGDMNTTENETAITRFKNAGFVDSYRQVHGDQTPTTGNTSPIVLKEGATQNPRRRIDFIFGRGAGGRSVKALTSEVCFKNHDSKGFYPSDHLGVMTTYEVKL
jgi:beta-glucosidase